MAMQHDSSATNLSEIQIITQAPSTPKKRRATICDVPADIVSPYFSPSKKMRASSPMLSESETPLSSAACKRKFDKNDTGNEYNISMRLERFATPETISLSTASDPLHRFYQRTFKRMYEKLALLKPELIQAEKVAGNPWQLLIAVTLLNKTSGKLAIPVFWEIMGKWPTALALSRANEEEVMAIIHHLGTQTIRTRRLINISTAYLQDPPSNHDIRPSKPSFKSLSWSDSLPPKTQRNHRVKYPSTPISHLPGTGPYALDSYRIFCTAHDDPLSDEWEGVLPTDKELIRFLWKWAYVNQTEWSPRRGILRPASVTFLKTLISELSNVVKSVA